MEGVTVVTHPLVQHKLTLLRDKNRSTKSFRELCKEIGVLLCYEVTRDLPLTDVEIETPLMRMSSARIAGKKLVFAPILRAGMTFVEGMLDLVPAARVAHIGLYRDPNTFVAIEYFFKAPSDLAERLVYRFPVSGSRKAQPAEAGGAPHHDYIVDCHREVPVDCLALRHVTHAVTRVPRAGRPACYFDRARAWAQRPQYRLDEG